MADFNERIVPVFQIVSNDAPHGGQVSLLEKSIREVAEQDWPMVRLSRWPLAAYRQRAESNTGGSEMQQVQVNALQNGSREDSVAVICANNLSDEEARLLGRQVREQYDQNVHADHTASKRKGKPVYNFLIFDALSDPAELHSIEKNNQT